MRVPGKFLLLPVAVFVIAPSVSFAQNNTAANAANLVIGQTTHETFTDAGNLARWYRTGAVAGRSYCAELWPSANNPTSINLDTTLTVFQSNGTTIIASNDDYFGVEPSGDPNNVGPSRVCWIHTAAMGASIRVQTRFFADALGSYRVRVTDTALQCPWWFTDSANGFEGFVQIRNNSGTTSVPVTVTAYNSAGAVQGAPVTATLAPNDNNAYSISTQFAAPVGSGSIVVTYGGGAANPPAGAPGTVSANLTSLSFTTGVGFDVPCTLRQDYLR